MFMAISTQAKNDNYKHKQRRLHPIGA